MSATDVLLELLDERGVSCQTHYLHASWCVGPKLYEAVDNLDGTLTVSNLTPEQAIAATLGGGECEDRAEAFTLLTNGTVCVGSKQLVARIAELQSRLNNAALGGGECEWMLREKWPNRTGDDHVYGYETSCGARHTWWPDSLPNFCPTCGGKVKAVKR